MSEGKKKLKVEIRAKIITEIPKLILRTKPETQRTLFSCRWPNGLSHKSRRLIPSKVETRGYLERVESQETSFHLYYSPK